MTQCGPTVAPSLGFLEEALIPGLLAFALAELLAVTVAPPQLGT